MEDNNKKEYDFNNMTYFYGNENDRVGISLNCSVGSLPKESDILYISARDYDKRNLVLSINEKDMYELKDYMIAICAEYDRIKEEADKKSRRAELIKLDKELSKQLNDVRNELNKLNGVNITF